jgi:hypothetical protein
MERFLSTVWVGAICVVAIIVTQCSPFASIPKRESDMARWEPIFFRSIERIESSVNIRPLRDTPLRSDEMEVRVWRGFGAQDLEAVILRRTNNGWSGSHIVSRDSYEPEGKTEITNLRAPKSGWDAFWNQVTELGLRDLPGRSDSDEECVSRIDGTGLVVEISKDRNYRTYSYPSDLPKCEGSLQMDKISNLIGIEFDDGTKKCQDAEWFPCADILQKRLDDDDKSKK